MFPFKNSSFGKLFDRAPRSFSSIRTKSTDNTIKHSPEHMTHRSNRSRTKTIKTFVRFRPLSINEIEIQNACINLTFTNDQSVNINGNSYQFQKVFTQSSTQVEVFRETTSHLIDNFFEGYDSTLMAYGQTGSGKTFTMFGDHRKGIIPLAGQQIFRRLNSSSRLLCSVLQIYNETILDLLNPDAKVKKLIPTLHQVKSAEHLASIITRCHQIKKVRTTALNDTSSRSHIVFTMHLEQHVGDQTLNSKFSLVDLAGNQRISKSNPADLNETKKINLSLSCLTKTIKALIKKQPYIPFRQSKLTQVLQDSLTGCLSMIITCSSHSSCLNETLNSLRFGVQSKRLQSMCTKNITINTENTVQKVLYDSLKSELENYEEKMSRIKEIVQSATTSKIQSQYLREIAAVLDSSINKQQKVFHTIKIPNFQLHDESSESLNVSSVQSKSQEISKLEEQISSLKASIQKYKQLIKPLPRDSKIEYLTFQKEVLMCQVQQLQAQETSSTIPHIRVKDQYIMELQKRIETLISIIRGGYNTEEKRILKVKKLLQVKN